MNMNPNYAPTLTAMGVFPTNDMIADGKSLKALDGLLHNIFRLQVGQSSYSRVNKIVSSKQAILRAVITIQASDYSHADIHAEITIGCQTAEPEESYVIQSVSVLNVKPSAHKDEKKSEWLSFYLEKVPSEIKSIIFERIGMALKNIDPELFMFSKSGFISKLKVAKAFAEPNNYRFMLAVTQSGEALNTSNYLIINNQSSKELKPEEAVQLISEFNTAARFNSTTELKSFKTLTLEEGISCAEFIGEDRIIIQ